MLLSVVLSLSLPLAAAEDCDAKALTAEVAALDQAAGPPAAGTAMIRTGGLTMELQR